MHRVELKEGFGYLVQRLCRVPNAPCGVESQTIFSPRKSLTKFLMHRVELKAAGLVYYYITRVSFLMHRVELKVTHVTLNPSDVQKFLMHRVELKERQS